MEMPLPSASLSIDRSKLPINFNSKYFPRIVDRVFFDTSSLPLDVSEPNAVCSESEETKFVSPLSSLVEVDMAVYVNVTRFLGLCNDAHTTREFDGAYTVQTIDKGSSKFTIFCTKPDSAFANEFDRVVSTLAGQLTPVLLERAADREATFCAVTDYVHWIFYHFYFHAGQVMLEIKAVNHTDTMPSVRCLVQLAFAYADQKLDAQVRKELRRRRELGRLLETMRPEHSKMYPRFECMPFAMSRRKSPTEPKSLVSFKTRSGVIDLLHDDIQLELVYKLSRNCAVVSLDNVKMVLQTFPKLSTWTTVVTIYTKWLSSLQGTLIPFFYSAVISDPFRGNNRRELGILFEHVQGIPLAAWLQSPLAAPYVSFDDAVELIKVNCTKTVEKINELGVSNCSLMRSFVVNPIDLSVTLTTWENASIGAKFRKGRLQLQHILLVLSNLQNNNTSRGHISPHSTI